MLASYNTVFVGSYASPNFASQNFTNTKYVRRHGCIEKMMRMMKWFKDIHNRQIRLTDERQEHIEADHPEMSGQFDKIQETLSKSDIIVRSRTDPDAELFYRHYNITPVTEKYLCVVAKILVGDAFIITAYFTDTIKRGEVLWERK